MYKLWTAAHYDWFTRTRCRSMPFSFRLFLECIRYCDWSIAQILSIHSLHSCIRCLKTCKVNECKTFGVARFRITHYLKRRSHQVWTLYILCTVYFTLAGPIWTLPSWCAHLLCTGICIFELQKLSLLKWCYSILKTIYIKWIIMIVCLKI